jgi:hypothetical protein
MWSYAENGMRGVGTVLTTLGVVALISAWEFPSEIENGIDIPYLSPSQEDFAVSITAIIGGIIVYFGPNITRLIESKIEARNEAIEVKKPI